jgi:hypothetical protein
MFYGRKSDKVNAFIERNGPNPKSRITVMFLRLAKPNKVKRTTYISECNLIPSPCIISHTPPQSFIYLPCTIKIQIVYTVQTSAKSFYTF